MEIQAAKYQGSTQISFQKNVKLLSHKDIRSLHLKDLILNILKSSEVIALVKNYLKCRGSTFAFLQAAMCEVDNYACELIPEKELHTS